jgi:hypothetical protein
MRKMTGAWTAWTGLALTCCAHAAVVGQWDFEQGNLSPTVGNAPIEYADGAGGTTEQGTQFGTTTALGIPDIGGQPARVMRFDAFLKPAGYNLPTPLVANGGGSLVNQWTLIMDVLYPTGSDLKYRALIDTDSWNTADADFFVGPNNGVGISGQYDGKVTPDQWHRIAFTVDQAEGVNQIKKYVDGELVGTQKAGGLDGRWGFSPAYWAVLFADDDGEVAPGYVNSIQLRDEVLSRGQIQVLGGAQAAGIPQQVPPVPSYIEAWIPATSVASRDTQVGVVLNVGDATVNPSAVALTLNGAVLSNPQVISQPPLLTVRKAPPAPLPIGAKATLVVSYPETLSGATQTRSFTNRFDVALYIETFDGLPLGPNVEEASAGDQVWTKTPPTGWTIDDTGMPGYDQPDYAENDGRKEWAGWSFADVKWWPTVDDQHRSWFTRASGAAAIADPDEWDDAPHYPGLYNSLLSSPPISLAGVDANTAVLRFDSSWRPEALDDGAPKFPVDANGNPTNNQTAVVRVSFDGAPPVEVLRMQSVAGLPGFKPDAENENLSVPLNNPAGARNMVLTFGLLYAANDWWWAVDNVSVTVGDVAPEITQHPSSTSRILGSSAVLSVTATGTNLRYQWKKDGQDLAGATASSLSLGPLQKSHAGSYVCAVSNTAGSATSNPAQVTVLDVPANADSLKQGLGAYLPFDGNYADVSGNNRNGSEVGAPSFAAGKVGQAVRVTNSRSATSYNFVTLGSNADLPFGQTEDFTVAFWAKAERTQGDPSIVATKNWGSGGNTGWTIGTQADGRVEWNYKRSTESRKDLDFTGRGNVLNDPNRWTHVVVVWRIAGNAETYVDGELVNLTPIGPGTGDVSSPDLAFNIGQDGTGAYTDGEWDGLVDDVAVWTRALSADEVVTLYAFGNFGESFFTAPPLTSDLAVNLRFEGNLSDASGSGNAGTAVGSPTFTAGKVGQGIRLNTDKPAGIFNYVTLGQATPVQFGNTKDFSVAFWARMLNWTDDPAFIANKNWGSGNNQGWVIATDGDGRVQWNYRRRNPDSPRKDFDSVGGLVSDKAWHHVAVVFAINGQAVTYFDGNAIEKDRNNTDGRKDITPSTGSLVDLARNLNIGQDGTGQYTDANLFDAVMDDVALWNRALTGREVAVLYNRGLNNQFIDGTPGPAPSPTLTYTLAGGQLTLGWDGSGFTLQENANLSDRNGWQAVPGAGANSATIPTSGAARFYRLIK